MYIYIYYLWYIHVCRHRYHAAFWVVSGPCEATPPSDAGSHGDRQQLAEARFPKDIAVHQLPACLLSHGQNVSKLGEATENLWKNHGNSDNLGKTYGKPMENLWDYDGDAWINTTLYKSIVREWDLTCVVSLFRYCQKWANDVCGSMMLGVHWVRKYSLLRNAWNCEHMC